MHPNYFKPDKNVINQFNPSGSPYFILRLVSLTASHDIGKSGIYDEFVKKIIFILEKKGKVFITSERKLPDFLEKYRIKINPLNIHHALYYANLVIGDSQTMIAEAAVLGTPAIRFNDFVGKLSYLEELEKKYKLAFGFRTNESEFLIEKIDELLTKKNLKKEWQRRRQKMLYEKIDVTDFMVWFIDNYPESFHIRKDNPDYQYNFK